MESDNNTQNAAELVPGDSHDSNAGYSPLYGDGLQLISMNVAAAVGPAMLLDTVLNTY